MKLLYFFPSAGTRVPEHDEVFLWRCSSHVLITAQARWADLGFLPGKQPWLWQCSAPTSALQHPPPHMFSEFILGKLLEIQSFSSSLFCFAGSGVIAAISAIAGKFKWGFPSHCTNPGKESGCVEGNWERERKSCCVMQKNFLASFNCLLRLEFSAFIFSSQAGGRNNSSPWLCQ